MKYKPGTKVLVISGGEGAYGVNDTKCVIISCKKARELRSSLRLNGASGHPTPFVLTESGQLWRLANGYELKVLQQKPIGIIKVLFKN